MIDGDLMVDHAWPVVKPSHSPVLLLLAPRLRVLHVAALPLHLTKSFVPAHDSPVSVSHCCVQELFTIIYNDSGYYGLMIHQLFTIINHYPYVDVPSAPFDESELTIKQQPSTRLNSSARKPSNLSTKPRLNCSEFLLQLLYLPSFTVQTASNLQWIASLLDILKGPALWPSINEDLSFRGNHGKPCIFGRYCQVSLDKPWCHHPQPVKTTGSSDSQALADALRPWLLLKHAVPWSRQQRVHQTLHLSGGVPAIG